MIINKALTLECVALTFLIMMTGCLEPREGCLDPLAENFDVTADKNCCCSYPELVLDLSYRVAEQNLASSTWYPNDLGQQFRITSFRIFLSDFALWNDGGEVFRITDSLEVELITSERAFIRDDIILLRNLTFSFPAGQFPWPGDYSALSFEVGLAGLKSSVDPESPLLPAEHPLRLGEDSLYTSEGFVEVRIAIEVDSVTADPYLYEFTGLQDALVQLSVDELVDKGQDLVIDLGVDFELWFYGVDWILMDEVEVMEQIEQNIPGSFFIRE
jgi:hypothetical protein